MQTDAVTSTSPPEARVDIAELTLLIAERAQQLAQRHRVGPGRELELWLEAEAEVKRERATELTGRPPCVEHPSH